MRLGAAVFGFISVRTAMAIDTSTPVPDTYWTLHTQWGIPTVIFSVLLVITWNNFQFTLTRIRVWLYEQRTSRFKLPPYAAKDIFNAYLHITTGGLGLIFVMPFACLLCWSILVITTHTNGLHAGISILFGGFAILWGVIGVNRWAGDGWLMRTPIAICFIGMSAFYFVVAFMLSFYGIGITFFGNSVHFMCLNFLCIVELMCVTEDTHRVDIEQMLELNEHDTLDGTGAAAPNTPNNRGGGGDVKSDALAVTVAAGSKKADESAVSKRDVMISVPPGTGSSVAPSDGLPPSVGRMAFDDPLQKQFGTVAVKKRQSSERAFLVYYGASIAILTAYSVAVWYYLNSDQSRYSGIIVSATIIVIDGGLYLYATTGRLSSNTTKLIVLAGTRIILISFGENNWFIGVAAVYVLAGCFLSFAVVDYRWPLSAAQEKNVNAKGAYKMRYARTDPRQHRLMPPPDV